MPGKLWPLSTAGALSHLSSHLQVPAWPIPDHWAQRGPFWKPTPGVSFKIASVPPSVASAQPQPPGLPAGRTRSSPGMGVLFQRWPREQEPPRWRPQSAQRPQPRSRPGGILSSAFSFCSRETEAQVGKGFARAAECRVRQKGAVAGLWVSGSQADPSWLCTVHFTSPALASSAGQWGRGRAASELAGFLLCVASEGGHFRTEGSVRTRVAS